jgi:hypothetical protein
MDSSFEEDYLQSTPTLGRGNDENDGGDVAVARADGGKGRLAGEVEALGSDVAASDSQGLDSLIDSSCANGAKTDRSRVV